MGEIRWYTASLKFEIIEGNCKVHEEILLSMGFNIAEYRDIKNDIYQKIYIFLYFPVYPS